MNVKQPTSVLWLIHSLEVLVMGAVFTFVITIYQAFQGGNFNLGSAGVTAASLLVAFLGNGLKGIINNANFAQAIHDLYDELFHQQQAQTPPVVINNHPPAVSLPQASAPVQSQVQQVPFPASNTFPMPKVTGQ